MLCLVPPEIARFAAGVCGFCFQEAQSASDRVVLMTRVYREDRIYPRLMAEEGHGTDVSVHKTFSSSVLGFRIQMTRVGAATIHAAEHSVPGM